LSGARLCGEAYQAGKFKAWESQLVPFDAAGGGVFGDRLDAEQYQIHPPLRLYEREGLLKPSRSEGNTRLYTDQDLERLEVILKLTRDLGVNLAGVEIILNMRERMAEMQHQIEQFVSSLNDEISQRSRQTIPEPAYSLIPVIEARRPKK
jgi:MerR family transcriptional regulator/heat shock protein HspR